MRLSRHARNRMRLYDITRADVALMLLRAFEVSDDGQGNRRAVGWVADRAICVIVAADDPSFVITLHPIDH